MHRVQTNAELEALHIAGAGFVFNHFTSGPAGARDNALHTASCPWVRRMLEGARPLARPSVRKMFFDTVDEAQSWLVSTLGPEGHGWKRCTGCRPGRTEAGTGMGLPAGTPPVTVREADGRAGAMLPTAPSPVPGSWPVHVAFAMPTSQPHRLPVPPRLASWNKAGDPDQVRLAKYLAAAMLSVRVEQAVPATVAPSLDCCYTVRTGTSSQSEKFKEQVRDQLAAARPLPPGPVAMQLCFTIGPGRNWLNLWKPAIDALGQILGNAAAASPWSPLDGRIVDLGLHCRVDPAMANDVLIAIAATHIRS